MATIEVACPYCHETKSIIKHGKGHAGHPRFFCKSCARTIQQSYAYKGCYEGVHETVVNMAMNGSGIRDTARVLDISPTTVIHILKNSNHSKLPKTST